MKIMMFLHGGSLNRGCEAIVRSSTTIIKEKINDSKVYLASNRPESDRVITALDGIYDGSDKSIRKYSYDWLLSSFKVKFLKMNPLFSVKSITTLLSTSTIWMSISRLAGTTTAMASSRGGMKLTVESRKRARSLSCGAAPSERRI